MDVTQKTDREFVAAKRNPFAMERVTSIPYRFEHGNWQTQLRELRALNYRAAIVGPQGTGKTTMLSQLKDELEREVERETVYLFLPQDKVTRNDLLRETLAEDLSRKILLVDGVERLSIVQRLALFRTSANAQGLIVTSHNPLRFPPFRLPTWIRTRPNELVLDYVLSELRMDDPEVRAAGKKSFRIHKGNLRDVLRDLYDRHSSLRFR